ncbi:ribonuclease R [Enterococcus asini]|uniref:ribonuclease R n=1 Tax=Enterococcus asini TaxID=57732 RepID=UPI00288CF0DB|nr:ribonuclease R [Enterococcus asini]MDT2756105.1 ribonuclease R [Enterococcus asini]
MVKDSKEQIRQFIRQSKKSSLSPEELAAGLGLQKSGDYKALIQTVAAMEQEGSVVFTKKGKIQLPPQNVLLEGIFRGNERGFGFVNYDEEEEDIYIPKDQTGYAMDGDTVAVDITAVADPFKQKGAEGKVVEIRKRNISQLVGEFTLFSEEEIVETDLYGVVKPKDKKLAAFQIFVAAEGIRPVDGSVVQVEITHYPEKGYASSLEGLVTSVLGHKDDPGMDILSIVVAHGIPLEFPEPVLTQANEVPDTIDPTDFPERRDLREQLVVTIDGADAKDLDDAVTVRKLENGHYFLGVHIADVSYYVTEDSPLDGEAFERGTSVYLTDRVIPMIPHRLSNGICSLNPNVPRLTMSCEMEINQEGKVVHHEIFPSIIQTTARMTYTSVNEILEEHNSETRARYQNLVPMFEDMAELHEILTKMRERRGAVSFEDREAQVVVDEVGHPEAIVLRSRGVGEKMIESFMLAANETVAEHFNKRHLPFLYRIHEEPKEDKLRRFFDFAATLGLVVKTTKGSITPTDLKKIVEEVADKPESFVVNTMLLRSMQQAKYSEVNYGHYGLGADYYTHFTSPIRRYPDLIVHRLIRAYGEDISKKNQEKWAEKLPEIALHSSQMERRAVECEREVDGMKKAEYMAAHVGEEFEGIVSSVVRFGLFVELPNTIEGMIHITNLKQDYFHFMETQLALVGERTGLTFKIGQKVKVKVIKADPVTQEIDFELVEAEEVTPIARQENRKRRRAREKNQKDRNQNKGKDKSKYKGKKKGEGHSQSSKQGKAKSGKKKNYSGKDTNAKKKPFYKGIKKKGK